MNLQRAGEAISKGSDSANTPSVPALLMRWRAGSYNCQSLTSWRSLGMILGGLSCTILGIQGTKLGPRRLGSAVPARYEQNWTERIGSYEIQHWGRPLDALANDCRGVALAVDRRHLRRFKIKRIECAGEALQGRGGFLRMQKRGYCGYDFWDLRAVFPVQKRSSWRGDVSGATGLGGGNSRRPT